MMNNALAIVIGVFFVVAPAAVFADTAVITNSVHTEADSSGGNSSASASVNTTVNGNTSSVTVSGGSTATVNTTHSTTPTNTSVNVTAAGGASVSVDGDAVSVTIHPTAAHASNKSTTINFDTKALVEGIAIIDLDGDGSPDSIDGTEQKNPVSVVLEVEKIRGISSEATRDALTRAVTDPLAVASAEDLILFSSRAALDDDQMDTVAFQKGDTIIEYHEHARLLGFIPMTLRTDVVAGSDGRVSVRFPWWHWIVTKPWSSSEIQADVFTSLEGRADAFQGLDLFPRQALIYQTVTNAMKARHEMAKNVIANVR